MHQILARRGGSVDACDGTYESKKRKRKKKRREGGIRVFVLADELDGQMPEEAGAYHR